MNSIGQNVNDTAVRKHSLILLVEDDELTRRTITALLSKKGYTVREASNGLEGLDLLSRERFDLVLTDIRMPVMDGRELLKRMSKSWADTPRIVLTAHDNESDILLALKTGAYDYLIKPIIDYTLLEHSIERALERKYLQEERDSSIRQMEHVNRVISMLNQGSDFEGIFRMLCDALQDILPCDRIAVFDFDSTVNRLSLKRAASGSRIIDLEKTHYDLPDALSRKLSQRKDVIIVEDPNRYMDEMGVPQSLRNRLGEDYSTFVSVPLVMDSMVRGFLVLGSCTHRAYTQEHTRFLSLIAGQIAFSLQRGDLLTDLSMHSKQLEKMVKIRTHEILKIQKTTIFALSKLAETRDNDTGAHLDRMRNYSVMLAQLLKYTGYFAEINNDFLKTIYDSSILHDIGKVGIPDSILLKAAPLTPEEFNIMMNHTLIGYRALDEASHGLGHDSFLTMSKNIALYHHEQWDGDGYPEGRSGEDIPLSARIVTIGDIYDALTTDRPYKKAFSHEKAVSIMKEEHYRFDPRIFKVFLENHQDFDTIRRQLT
ncbi:MAG: HD domain-containing phosphohydrolase [Spirochaetota bacterium]